MEGASDNDESFGEGYAEASNSGLQEDAATSPVQDNSYEANDESQLSASMEPSVEASVEASMEDDRGGDEEAEPA
eukprot:CAMPEP_0172202110 /NCGR_PEP_ID=MMETSP1050-20130122/30431_1 /TAXON_ID=233186 /ORGANISM="Cryptomonas curvata, Strain CCAP979/52" /LENGTH=74 /DNA_ID=CAMNT_0012879947 /DNA_START=115 /DNA_END=336 /DNA_ORIENTATION=+